MAGQAEILASLLPSQQAGLLAVRHMAAAAGQVPFPVEWILSRQAAFGCKAAGVANLNGARVAADAKQFLRCDQLRHCVLISVRHRKVAGLTGRSGWMCFVAACLRMHQSGQTQSSNAETRDEPSIS